MIDFFMCFLCICICIYIYTSFFFWGGGGMGFLLSTGAVSIRNPGGVG